MSDNLAFAAGMRLCLQSPFFLPLAELVSFGDYEDWPSLAELNQQTPETVTNIQGHSLHCIAPKPVVSFAEQYEPSVYLQGALPTRERNWHDFFNLMVWQHFPKTKAILNLRQYEGLAGHQPDLGARSLLENRLAQFDECGVVIVTSNPVLAELIIAKQWTRLFCEHRQDVCDQMEVFLLGHGVYEKALSPYIGLTAHGIVQVVQPEFLQAPLAERVALVDAQTAAYCASPCATQKLTPLPLLGVPGWWPANAYPGFYQDDTYFRSPTLVANPV